MELISWLISLIDEGLAVPAVAISIGSLMLAFPVRALAQGSLCQCTPLGEGVWGRWLGAPLRWLAIEVMVKILLAQDAICNITPVLDHRGTVSSIAAH